MSGEGLSPEEMLLRIQAQADEDLRILVQEYKRKRPNDPKPGEDFIIGFYNGWGFAMIDALPAELGPMRTFMITQAMGNLNKSLRIAIDAVYAED